MHRVWGQPRLEQARGALTLLRTGSDVVCLEWWTRVTIEGASSTVQAAAGAAPLVGGDASDTPQSRTPPSGGVDGACFSQRIRAVGRHDLVSTVHGSTCEPGDTGVVCTLSEPRCEGDGRTGGSRVPHSVDRLLSRQGSLARRDGPRRCRAARGGDPRGSVCAGGAARCRSEDR